ncbi:MAG: DUF6090 family protein [Balneolaceae bacterium]
MLRFFRNIRQKLTQQGNMRKYIWYALGEIALVMIGILLALQVNNWNEKRIVEAEINAIVQNLNSEFRENLGQLNLQIQGVDSVIAGLEKILELTYMEDQDIGQSNFDKILESTLSAPSWLQSSMVLEELKYSGGLSRLNDETLKRLLFDWERHYLTQQDFLESYNLYALSYIEHLSTRGSVRTLDAMSGNFPGLKPSIIAENSLSMLKDPVFENRVDNFYALASIIREDFGESADKLKAIIEHTEDY